MKILMDLMEIPEQSRNFLELKNGIEKLQLDYLGEKERADSLASQYSKDTANVEFHNRATLENIISNPGLQHLAEKIFFYFEFKRFGIL